MIGLKLKKAILSKTVSKRFFIIFFLFFMIILKKIRSPFEPLRTNNYTKFSTKTSSKMDNLNNFTAPKECRQKLKYILSLQNQYLHLSAKN